MGSELAEQMNVISEMLLGHREGSYPDIIQAIAHFKSKAYKHEMNIQVESIFDLIDKLSDEKDNILADEQMYQGSDLDEENNEQYKNTNPSFRRKPR